MDRSCIRLACSLALGAIDALKVSTRGSSRHRTVDRSFVRQKGVVDATPFVVGCCGRAWHESHLWLPEHEVRDGRLPVPIDQRNGGHIERDVQNHWKPELPGDCVDRAEHQAGHRRLLYPG